MKQLDIYLQNQPIGKVRIDCVRGRETWMFSYDPSFVNVSNPMLDPDVANVPGPQFPRGGAGFGFLSDVAPDRWGRKLIRRREKRTLLESDYILGVCDMTRQGAIRIKTEPDGPFVSSDIENAAPPWTTLRKLEDSARHLDADGEGDHSYLEIAEWLSQNGAEPESDLRELWRRVVFSYFIGNTDDHLRNHGFLLTPKGWRLAPLFDVNPNPDGGEHALDLGDPVKDADYYRLTQAEARCQYEEIRKAVGTERM